MEERGSVGLSHAIRGPTKDKDRTCCTVLDVFAKSNGEGTVSDCVRDAISVGRWL